MTQDAPVANFRFPPDLSNLGSGRDGPDRTFAGKSTVAAQLLQSGHLEQNQGVIISFLFQRRRGLYFDHFE